MGMKYSGNGSSSGALSVDNNHIFDIIDDRDDYFTTYPDELVEDMYCVAAGTLYKYVGGTWVDSSAVIQGDTGDKGETGSSITAQYSSDAATWADSYTADTDIYIRFSDDGGDTYTDAAKFVGTDGDTISVQYSTSGSDYHDTFDSDNDKYLRVVTTNNEGTSTYADGVRFVGWQGAGFSVEYSADEETWNTTFDSSTDMYMRIITTTKEGVDTVGESVQFVADAVQVQYSSEGDNSWHDTLDPDNDVYWRWSTDGGDTYTDDFVRFKTDVDVSVATEDEAGVVKPDGTSITITDDGTISATAAAATKVVVANETEMLALEQIDNLYIATRSDLEDIWYLNASLDPSDLANWEEGASISETVASWSGAGDDTPQTGDVVASNTDYTMDMIRGEDVTTAKTYYLEIDNGALYLVEV